MTAAYFLILGRYICGGGRCGSGTASVPSAADEQADKDYGRRDGDESGEESDEGDNGFGRESHDVWRIERIKLGLEVEVSKNGQSVLVNNFLRIFTMWNCVKQIKVQKGLIATVVETMNGETPPKKCSKFAWIIGIIERSRDLLNDRLVYIKGSTYSVAHASAPAFSKKRWTVDHHPITMLPMIGCIKRSVFTEPLNLYSKLRAFTP